METAGSQTPANSKAATGSGTLSREAHIHEVAAKLFMEKGFDATSMRELARMVGIEAASLYNHVPSKQDLLADLLLGAMTELVRIVQTTAEEAGGGPAERLRAVIVAYVAFHRDHYWESAITDSERRSLTPGNAEQLIARRDALAQVFHRILEDGRDSGVFHYVDLHLETIFILSIIARLPVWYRPEGSVSLERIGELIADFVLAALTNPGRTVRP